jgi:hypothetical protein
MLSKGEIVGLALDGQGEELLRALAARGFNDAIPVFTAKEKGLIVVEFGEWVSSTFSIEEMRAVISRLRPDYPLAA